MSAGDIKSFATQYDPQPFHTDDAAAVDSVFGELVASGWQTASLTMSLAVRGELQLAGGWIGLGIDSLQWPHPVRPGDSISAISEVIEKRESKSKPQWGVIKVRTQTLNQSGVKVCEIVSNQLVRRRGP